MRFPAFQIGLHDDKKESKNKAVDKFFFSNCSNESHQNMHKTEIFKDARSSLLRLGEAKQKNHHKVNFIPKKNTNTATYKKIIH